MSYLNETKTSLPLGPPPKNRYTSTMNDTAKHPLTLQEKVPETLGKTRLDRAMAILFPTYSRSLHKQWILAGEVQVNDTIITKPRHSVVAHQTIKINAVIETQTRWEAEPIALDVVFEDDQLLVINKPSGLVTHPGAGNPNNTLVNAILHHHQQAEALPRGGIIHRLDKDTSGLLVAAKTRESHFALTQAMQKREIQREYEAVVEGTLIAGNTIEAPIGRHPVHRIKMAVVNNGKPAVTHYRVIARYQSHTHVKVTLETGRTHQIRVHFRHINHPLVGDRTYNPRRNTPANINDELKHTLQQFQRQALHARRLSLQHPTTKEPMTWQAPLPSDFQALIAALKSNDT